MKAKDFRLCPAWMYTLKAGEKDRIIDAIDTLSGYESNIEEVAKN